MTLPDLPPVFRWTVEPFGPALRCVPLERVAPHLFTTRQLPLSSEDDWARVASALGAERVQTLAQVHGKAVVVVRSPEGLRHTAEGLRHDDDDVAQRSGAATSPEADVLVSNDPRVAIAVRAADCVPLLIADPKTGAVAAVHAGWRGTAAGAAAAAVEALGREFGARPSDLVAAIGPSIGACCYEVGSDVVDAFAAAGHARHLVDRWFLSRPRESTLRLDTAGANRDQLILAGVAEENIHLSGLCTAERLDLFPSYRAERAHAGRIAGAIRNPESRI
jgi:YfiH family protein